MSIIFSWLTLIAIMALLRLGAEISMIVAELLDDIREG